MNITEAAPSTPVWLWIDPTRACNLKCKFCYSVPSHRNEHLTPGNLRLFLQRVLENKQLVIQKLHLNWRGDPTMNPELPLLLAEIESVEPNFPWELHTNGTLITPDLAKQITQVLKTGHIFVSIDGGSAESHDANRGRGTFREALSGLQCLIESRGSRSVPKLGVFQLDFGEDPDLYDAQFASLLAQVDAWVSVYPIHPRDGHRYDFKSAKRPRLRGAGTRSASEAEDRWWSRPIPESIPSPGGPCFWAGNAYFVAPDGDVSICLISHSSDGIMGNLLKEDFAEIVARAKRFRASLLSRGRSCIGHCATCRMAEGEPQPLIPRSLTA